MCIITGTTLATIGAGIATAAHAVGAAVVTAGTAIHAALGTTLIGGGVVTSGAAAGTVTGGLTVGGALAGLGIAALIGTGAYGMYQSSRASARAQKAQEDAIKNLQEGDVTQNVNKTATGIAEGARANRPLGSLRISMLPQKQNKDDISKTVYGVDTNTVASATQNMTGLNIATA